LEIQSKVQRPYKVSKECVSHPLCGYKCGYSNLVRTKEFVHVQILLFFLDVVFEMCPFLHMQMMDFGLASLFDMILLSKEVFVQTYQFYPEELEHFSSHAYDTIERFVMPMMMCFSDLPPVFYNVFFDGKNSVLRYCFCKNAVFQCLLLATKGFNDIWIKSFYDRQKFENKIWSRGVQRNFRKHLHFGYIHSISRTLDVLPPWIHEICFSFQRSELYHSVLNNKGRKLPFVDLYAVYDDDTHEFDGLYFEFPLFS